jgi:biopolymer transport protein ExbD
MDMSLAIINVVLLLIFYFLVTGQIVAENADDVDVARTTELPADQLPGPLLVINPDGTWLVDGTPVAPEFFDLAIAALPEPLILYILISRDAPASTLLGVVNRPELANAEIRLVTLDNQSTEAGTPP